MAIRTAHQLLERDGLVSTDGVWGMHLDGYHVNLTHRASGKRVGRFTSLGDATSVASSLAAMPDVDWTTNNPYEAMSVEQECTALKIIATFQLKQP